MSSQLPINPPHVLNWWRHNEQSDAWESPIRAQLVSA